MGLFVFQKKKKKNYLLGERALGEKVVELLGQELNRGILGTTGGQDGSNRAAQSKDVVPEVVIVRDHLVRTVR